METPTSIRLFCWGMFASGIIAMVVMILAFLTLLEQSRLPAPVAHSQSATAAQDQNAPTANSVPMPDTIASPEPMTNTKKQAILLWLQIALSALVGTLGMVVAALLPRYWQANLSDWQLNHKDQTLLEWGKSIAHIKEKVETIGQAQNEHFSKLASIASNVHSISTNQQNSGTNASLLSEDFSKLKHNIEEKWRSLHNFLATSKPQGSQSSQSLRSDKTDNGSNAYRVNSPKRNPGEERDEQKAEQAVAMAERMRKEAEQDKQEAQQEKTVAQALNAAAEKSKRESEQARASAEAMSKTARQEQQQAQRDRAAAQALKDTVEQDKQTIQREREAAQALKEEAERAKDIALQAKQEAQQHQQKINQMRSQLVPPWALADNLSPSYQDIEFQATEGNQDAMLVISYLQLLRGFEDHEVIHRDFNYFWPILRELGRFLAKVCSASRMSDAEVCKCLIQWAQAINETSKGRFVVSVPNLGSSFSSSHMDTSKTNLETVNQVHCWSVKNANSFIVSKAEVS